MMLNFTGEEVYGADEPPKVEWCDDNSRLWYEERPRMILHFYDHWHINWKPDRGVAVFVNMSFRPTTQDIEAFIRRGLSAGGIKYKGITNLRLNNWSGSTNAFWYADFITNLPKGSAS